MLKVLTEALESAREATQLLEGFQEEIARAVANNDFQEISNTPVRRHERVIAVIVDPELKALLTVVGRRMDALPSAEVVEASEGKEREDVMKAHAYAQLLRDVMWRELRTAHGIEGDEGDMGVRDGWKFVQSDDPLSALLGRRFLRMSGAPVSVMDLLEGDCDDPDCLIHGKRHATAQA